MRPHITVNITSMSSCLYWPYQSTAAVNNWFGIAPSSPHVIHVRASECVESSDDRPVKVRGIRHQLVVVCVVLRFVAVNVARRFTSHVTGAVVCWQRVPSTSDRRVFRITHLHVQVLHDLDVHVAHKLANKYHKQSWLAVAEPSEPTGVWFFSTVRSGG